MHDNRHTMREMLFPHTAAERAQMIEQVRTNGTDALWQDYTASIFEPADRQNYQTTMLARSNYLQGCNQFLDLMSAGRIDEAAVLFNGELSRKFQDYNATAKNLFDYNMRQGIDRGKIILETSTYAPWVIAGVCVLMFGFGLLLGLRLVLSGAKLTRRQSNS
jgi:hypothetical protein